MKFASAAALSCNGRGTRMWSQPNHDVSVLHEVCGPIPVAGDLEPVGGWKFICGRTANITRFSPTR